MTATSRRRVRTTSPPRARPDRPTAGRSPGRVGPAPRVPRAPRALRAHRAAPSGPAGNGTPVLWTTGRAPWTSLPTTVDDPPRAVDDAPLNVDHRPPAADASVKRLTTTCCDANHSRTTTSCGFGLDHDPSTSYSQTVAPPPDDARNAVRSGQPGPSANHPGRGGKSGPVEGPVATSPHPRDTGQPPGRSS